MAATKSRTKTTGQRAQDPARRASPHDEIPSVGEQAQPAVFDEDSMFNSADRQSAILRSERTGRKGLQKTTTKTARKQTERRKAA